MRRALVIALGAVLLGATLAGAAEAQGSVPQRRFGVSWRGGVPRVHFSAVDLVDERLRDQLRSGTYQHLVMRVYAYRENGEPLAVTVRSCRVHWDVWPRVFFVQYRSARRDEDERFESLDDVLERCLVARRVPVGRASHYRSRRGERIYFAAILEVNPLTPGEVQRIRRWLSRPAGGGRIGGEAFFGSFVSLFVNRRIGSAERTLRFRSQRVRIR